MIEFSAETNESADPRWISCAQAYIDEMLRTQASRQTQESALNDVAYIYSKGAHRDWHRLPFDVISPGMLRQIASSEKLSGHQQPKAVAALRGAARIAMERGLISQSDFIYMKDLSLRFTEEEPAERSYLPDTMLGKLIRICREDETITGARDAAMFALAFQSGMRRNELRSFQIDQLTQTSEGVFRLHILGKGVKKRAGEVAGHAGMLLNNWIILRGAEPGPLFARIRKGGKLDASSSLSMAGLQHILSQRLKKAEIDPVGWHDFRRKFATDLYRKGIPLATIQKLLGHANQKTTLGYLITTNEEEFDAASMLNTPLK